MSFSNVETAAVFRELLEEADDIESFADAAEDLEELADWIQEDYEAWYGPIEGNCLANFFACNAMELIKWREIAQHLVAMLARRAEKGASHDRS